MRADRRTDGLTAGYHSLEEIALMQPAKNKPYLGLRVKYPTFLPAFIQNWISRQIFMEVCNIKFHGNPSSGSYVDNAVGLTYGQVDGQTFYDYANAPKRCRLRLPSV